MLNAYKVVVQFIGQFLGNQAEVLLFDLKENRLIAIENQLDQRHHLGDPVSHAEKEFIEDAYDLKAPFIMNYRAFTSDHRRLRSATLFIKDDAKITIGLLTINYLVGEFEDMKKVLDHLISGQVGEEAPVIIEAFDNSVDNLMAKMVSETFAPYRHHQKRLTAKEKKGITKALDDKGVFLIKGSVTYVANILGTSEVSIYRYLNREKEEGAQ